MSVGAVGFNPFDYDPRQIQSAGKVGAHGGSAVGGSPHGQQMVQKEQELDPMMLAQKAQGFQTGLGGTNNPDDHKIFFAA